MRPSTTARRYAEAAFGVASSNGEVQQWRDDLERASDVQQQETVNRYFRDPNVPHAEKLDTAERVFAGVRPHVLNLIRMLVIRQRLYLLPAIAREFQDLAREAEGIVEAFVTVARPIDGAEQEEIRRRLATLTGKSIEIQTHVDPAILGGIVVRLGDRLVDASVAGRLQRLRQEMAV